MCSFTFACWACGNFYKTIRHYITWTWKWLSTELQTELWNFCVFINLSALFPVNRFHFFVAHVFFKSQLCLFFVYLFFIWCDNRDSVKQLCKKTRKWCWLCLTGNYFLPSGGLNAFLLFFFFFFFPQMFFSQIFMKNKNAACLDSGMNLGVLPVWVQLKPSNVYF